MVVYEVINFQEGVINDYLTKIAFTNFQSISDATAQLKKNDLQELFRESSILDALFSMPLEDSNYYSSAYITSAKTNEMMSSSECSSDNQCVDGQEIDKMVYYLFPQDPMTMPMLDGYSPANSEIDL